MLNGLSTHFLTVLKAREPSLKMDIASTVLQSLILDLALFYVHFSGLEINIERALIIFLMACGFIDYQIMMAKCSFQATKPLATSDLVLTWSQRSQRNKIVGTLNSSICNCTLENYDCRKNVEFITEEKTFNMSNPWEAEINHSNEVLGVDCQVEEWQVIYLFLFKVFPCEKPFEI